MAKKQNVSKEERKRIKQFRKNRKNGRGKQWVGS